jgi:hypothetical protein
MKTELVKKEKVFEPVKIELTFESPEEMKKYREQLKLCGGCTFGLYKILEVQINKYYNE